MFYKFCELFSLNTRMARGSNLIYGAE